MGKLLLMATTMLLSLQPMGNKENSIIDTTFLEALLEEEVGERAEDMEIVEYSTGDLGDDGTANIVVVVSYPETKTLEEQLAIYLFEENDKHEYDLFKNNIGNIQEKKHSHLDINVKIDKGELLITTTNKDNNKKMQKNTYIYTQEDSIYSVELTEIIVNEKGIKKGEEIRAVYDMMNGTVITKKVMNIEEHSIEKVKPEIIYEGYFEPNTNPLKYWKPNMEDELHPIDMGELESLVKQELLEFPKDATILDFAIGDIGYDKIRDIAIVVELKEKNDLSRVLCLFTEESEGIFTYRCKNENIILSSNEGGSGGDPYDNIAISWGDLIVSDYSGGIERKETSYHFSQEEEGLKLILVESKEFTTDTEEGELSSYDYRYGRKLVETFSENEDFISEIDGSFHLLDIPFEKAKANQQDKLDLLDRVDVENMIKNQIEILPESFSLLDFCIGDIGHDGYEDIIVVIEYLGEDEYETECLKRTLYVFQENKKGEIKYLLQNEKLILDRGSGGVFGDPYAGILIKNGDLTVSDYGGSSDRWGNDYIFQLVGEEIILVKIENQRMSTHSGQGTITIYDFKEGTVVEKAYSDWDEEFEQVLIYEGSFSSNTITLEHALAWNQSELKEKPSYPMPSLGYYIYGEQNIVIKDDGTTISPENLNYSAEEILDKIKELYYPDMIKVEIQASEEILGNYSQLLLYEVPRYFYTDGNNSLSYFNVEFHNHYEQWEHTIHYNGKDSESYWMWDETGKEREYN